MWCRRERRCGLRRRRGGVVWEGEEVWCRRERRCGLRRRRGVV